MIYRYRSRPTHYQRKVHIPQISVQTLFSATMVQKHGSVAWILLILPRTPVKSHRIWQVMFLYRESTIKILHPLLCGAAIFIASIIQEHGSCGMDPNGSSWFFSQIPREAPGIQNWISLCTKILDTLLRGAAVVQKLGSMPQPMFLPHSSATKQWIWTEWPSHPGLEVNIRQIKQAQLLGR